jgi:hypothetical protein
MEKASAALRACAAWVSMVLKAQSERLLNQPDICVVIEIAPSTVENVGYM